MKTVDRIISITYDKSYQKITIIKFSIGPLSYTMKMNYNCNCIHVTTNARYTFLNVSDIPIKDFISVCKPACDVDSFLHVIYPDIDIFLICTRYLENDSIALFEDPNFVEDPEFDMSKLNEFVSNPLVSKCFPSVSELIAKNNTTIEINTEKIKQAVEKINYATKKNTILMNIGRRI